MRKKGIAFILSFAMILSIVPSNSFGGDFTDMPSDWSTKALEKAVKNGLLKGNNGKIRPGDTLTRAELATIINRAFNSLEKAPLTGFKDLSQNDWYYDEMAKALMMETFIGNDGKLKPNEKITREEAFVVLSRAFKIPGGGQADLDGFSDKNDISDWAKDQIGGLFSATYLAGSQGKINPKSHITRAEFAQIMDNLVATYINEPGDYSLDIKGNVMVNQAGVVLKGMTIDGDLIIGEGLDKGQIIIEDTKVKGRLLVRGGGKDSIKIMGKSDIEKNNNCQS